MAEVLLSISEAAKLMDVCENTLREWDDNEKFPALRTEGGHRRYELDKIREWIDQKEPESISNNDLPWKNESERIYSKWKDSEYLSECENQGDKFNLAILLENAILSHRANQDTFSLSEKQILYIVSQGWNKSKLKKIVSVQPLLGPTGLVYYCDRSHQNFKLEHEPVAAHTLKYNFSIYPDANVLEGICEVYATMLATEIDLFICEKMSTTHLINIEDMVSALYQDKNALKPEDCSYVATSASYIKGLSQLSCFKEGNIDLIEIQTQLDPDTYAPISLCGRYPKNDRRIKPIFCPYMLLVEFPTILNGSRGAGLRAGWLD